jgi:hypothetical protein
MGKACVPVYGSEYPRQTAVCRHGLLGPCVLCHDAAMTLHMDAIHHIRRPISLELEVADDFVRPQSVINAESKPAPGQEAA